jgi:hypothetical protein
MLKILISGLQGLNMAGRAQPFRKQAGGNQESFTAQTNVETAFGNLSRSILLDGVYLENILIGTSDTLVEHKLNRSFRGYILCKNDNFSQLKLVTTGNDVTKFLTLQATVPCTISLWIF